MVTSIKNGSNRENKNGTILSEKNVWRDTVRSLRNVE
jgi:hypothetical protein